MPGPVLTGTTTVALKYKNGVVLAADKRGTVDLGYSRLVASRNLVKVLILDDYIAMTVSGVLADAQKLYEYLRTRIRFFKLERRRKPTVKEVALFTSTVAYGHLKSYIPLITHVIIGGVDLFGPHVFFLDEAGSLLEDDYIATGSGSPVAFGYLDAAYKDGLEEDEAIRVAITAVRSAIMRDTATGDGIDVVVINDRGARMLSKEEVMKYMER